MRRPLEFLRTPVTYGARNRIIALCGENATSKFRGQHGAGGKAITTLKKYKIGVLA